MCNVFSSIKNYFLYYMLRNLGSKCRRIDVSLYKSKIFNVYSLSEMITFVT